MTEELALPSRADARAMLRSLRDGTVPDTGVELLTVGRDGWLRSFERDLEDVAAGQKQVRIINGRYGDGKTHVMTVVREMALRMGFATSYITIRSDVPLSRWDLLYKAIVTSIETRTKRGPGGLCALIASDQPDPSIADGFRDRARTIRSLTAIDGSFARAAYGYATGQGPTFVDPADDMLTFRNWLEGNAVSADARRPLGLSTNVDRSNAHRMFESLIGVLRHLGYAGLVLLLDEVESTLDQRETVRSAAYDNLRSLVDRHDLPQGCLVVCSITPEMFTDEERGIPSYEALWQRLKPVGDSQGVNFDATVADLGSSPLTAGDYFKVGERLRLVHGFANDWDAGPRLTSSFLKDAATTAVRARSLAVAATRILVKVVIDELDRAQSDPKHVADARRLPVAFDRIARELSEARSTEEWDSN